MNIPSQLLHKPSEHMPRWALMERQVFDILSKAPRMLEDYLTPEGELFWPESVKNFQAFADGSMDNVYEGFRGFPLLYLLGGEDSLLEYAQREYDVLTAQLSKIKKTVNLGLPEEEAERLGRDTMLVDEMPPDGDWMHTGEAMNYLYYLLMANPAHKKNRDRILRFAQYYIGENPAGLERNYDPEHRVFHCAYMGSNGPAHNRYRQPIYHMTWMDTCGLAFYDVPGITTYLDLEDPKKAEYYGKIYGERLGHCDTITNLLSTGLAAHAYAVSGDTTYRDFITDYVGAWRERSKGQEFMPDNAGPTGKVGETLGGRFYGAHYGWTFPHGIYFIEDALIVGGECERLVTGRRDAVDWAKELYNKLIDRYGIAIEGAGILIPQKRADNGAHIEFWGNKKSYMVDTDTKANVPRHVRYKQRDGWFEWGRAQAPHWGHIYAASGSAEDYERIREIFPPQAGEISATPRLGKSKGGEFISYIRYLRGDYPTYPEDILQHTLDIYYRQNVILENRKRGTKEGFGYAPNGVEEMEILKAITAELEEKYHLGWDESIVHAYYQVFFINLSPLSVEGLLQLTTGAMAPIYNGGLICAEARWFDMDRRRPGLCEGVAALISEITENGFTVTLANTDVTTHNLVMQGGAYGEHNILTVDGEDVHLEAGGKWISLILTPGTVVTLQVALERWVNAPSFEEPFGTYDRLEG